MNEKVVSLTAKLSKENYPTIERELKQVDSNILLLLVDGSSGRIADVAGTYLVQRGERELLKNAILSNSLRTKRGRVVATNTLMSFGPTFGDLAEILSTYINDRSIDVFSNVIFGIVMSQRYDYLEKFKRMRNETFDEKRRILLGDAIAAMEFRDPMSYSPGFVDSQNIWGLRPK